MATKKRIKFFAVVFAIFWLAITLILILGLVRVSKLIPVEGQLIAAREMYRSSHPISLQAPSWQLDVDYTYSFNGKSYQGSRLRVGGNGMVLESFAKNKADEMMSANRRVTVWIDPKRPDYAVLERQIGLVGWLFWVGFFALTCLVYYISPKVESRQKLNFTIG